MRIRRSLFLAFIAVLSFPHGAAAQTTPREAALSKLFEKFTVARRYSELCDGEHAAKSKTAMDNAYSNSDALFLAQFAEWSKRNPGKDQNELKMEQLEQRLAISSRTEDQYTETYCDTPEAKQALSDRQKYESSPDVMKGEIEGIK